MIKNQAHLSKNILGVVDTETLCFAVAESLFLMRRPRGPCRAPSCCWWASRSSRFRGDGQKDSPNAAMAPNNLPHQPVTPFGVGPKKARCCPLKTRQNRRRPEKIPNSVSSFREEAVPNTCDYAPNACCPLYGSPIEKASKTRDRLLQNYCSINFYQ